MDKWVMCVVFLILGMLMANMFKDVCGCKNVMEGQEIEEEKCTNMDKCRNGRPGDTFNTRFPSCKGCKDLHIALNQNILFNEGDLKNGTNKYPPDPIYFDTSGKYHNFASDAIALLSGGRTSLENLYNSGVLNVTTN